jgi:formylglycine-generating enzyme required for sulfatase activity
MNRGGGTRGPVVGVAAVVLAVVVAQVALAGTSRSSDAQRASAGAVGAKQFKQLKQQVAALQQQVNALARQPGPQGPQGSQGPAGSAPACAGNGSGDAMVAAGAVCIDKYEVSVWSSPTGGTQYGASSDNYPCDDEGQDCKAGTAGEIYARSVPGVTPSRFITYFQAQAALANVGKRLPSNAEWQQAVAGTPDPGNSPAAADCNTNSAGPSATGSRANCVSNFGAFDMVGNLYEWVADWVPASTTCTSWSSEGTFSSDDDMCLSGASTTATAPAALFRGATYLNGAVAGPFAVGDNYPSRSFSFIGFRGVR